MIGIDNSNVDILLNEDNSDENKKEEEKKDSDENQTLKKLKILDDIDGKERLIKVLNRLKKDLEQEIKEKKEENIDSDITSESNTNDEEKEKEEEEDNIIIVLKGNWNIKICKIFFHFMFMFVLPFLVTINLIGIFQIISIMNVLYDCIKKSIICFLGKEDKEDQSFYDFYNFYGYYLKESINEDIEFDLIETMGFLGLIFYKFSGFTVSSMLFLGINGISLFLITNFFNQYRPGNERYTGFQIIYLCTCYMLLFIGVGSSALLSQQILVGQYEKYNSFLKKTEDNSCSCWGLFNICRNCLKKEKEDENKDKKGKEKIKEKEKGNVPYFLLICITSILGYFFKYTLDIFISNRKYQFDKQYNITDIDTNEINNLMNNMTNIEINNIIFSHDKKLFFIIIFIYIITILLSIILYKILKSIYETNKKKQHKLKIGMDDGKCQICGYVIYTENLNLELNKKNENGMIKQKEDGGIKGSNNEGIPSLKKGQLETLESKLSGENIPIKNKKKKLPRRILDCIESLFKKLFLCLRLLSDSFISCFNEVICKFYCCEMEKKTKERCCCCFCCECLINNDSKIKDKNYEQKDEFFCYCYKEKRNMKWFNRFIREETHIRLMPLLLEYFIIQLTTIAFEKINNENNEDKYNNFEDHKSIYIFIGKFSFSLFLFFYFTISFGQIFIALSGRESIQKTIEKISNKILNGTYGILIFNGFYSFIVSLICLIKDIKLNDNYIFIPILMNKFYFFTFAYHCTVYTDVDEGIDIISSATLLSIYLKAWEFFFNKLIDKCSINILLVIQIFFSLIIVLLTSCLISVFLCCIGYFWFTFLYLLSFIPFGGFWYFRAYEKCRCDQYECCIDNGDICDNNYKCLYYCIDKKKLTQCISGFVN